jgi:hypothetical protein
MGARNFMFSIQKQQGWFELPTRHRTKYVKLA